MITGYLRTATSNPLSIIGDPGVTIVDRNNAVLYVTHCYGASAGKPGHIGVWTGVMHKFPHGWRIMHSHSSDRSSTE